MADRSKPADALHDTQSSPDYRNIRIDKVGVRGVRHPIKFKDANGVTQDTVAIVGMAVDLPKEVKGTHMSRFIEALHARNGRIELGSISELLADLRKRLHSETAHLEMEFPYFRVKAAPVTGIESAMDYQIRIEANAIRDEVDIVLSVATSVTTLCPCSKAISKYGAHNQRGTVTVQTRARQPVSIEEIIEIAESSASSELYALLKREDEKAVTERAYENPVFVEDLIRNVAVKLNAHPLIAWYKIEAENFESIHNHNAYACIEMG
ncbi:MAG: GTP cyclohydrolase I [Candidatus Binatia bacterium]|jgi:GTP cyclohydrolase I